MFKKLIILFLFVPSIVFAQATITGKVIAAEGNQPISDASVFLSNASIGGRTSTDGAFNLKNIKNGQYDLVVSCIGYEPHQETVLINGKDISLPDIKLAVKVNMLKEIKIGSVSNSPRYLRQFTRELFGPSENAGQCKILNPEIINLAYSKKTGDLKVSSDDFLIIENKALGYTIKYLLSAFAYNSETGNLYYAGSSVFEPMKGTPAQQKRWDINRTAVYNGSLMHFLRICLANQLNDQLFDVFKVVRAKSVDPHASIKRDQPLTINPNPKAALSDIVINEPLSVNNFIKPTDMKGIFAFGFSDGLKIFSKQAAQATIITFVDEYSLFDTNGFIINPKSNLMEGHWGNQRIADLLPVDYVPTINSK